MAAGIDGWTGLPRYPASYGGSMSTDVRQQLLLLREAIAFCRSIVLDSVELELGEHVCWPQLRTRLLRAFGERGLEGRMLEIFRGEL